MDPKHVWQGREAKRKKRKITVLAKHLGAARQMLPSLPPNLLPGLVFSLLHKTLFKFFL